MHLLVSESTLSNSPPAFAASSIILSSHHINLGSPPLPSSTHTSVSFFQEKARKKTTTRQSNPKKEKKKSFSFWKIPQAPSSFSITSYPHHLTHDPRPSLLHASSPHLALFPPPPPSQSLNLSHTYRSSLTHTKGHEELQLTHLPPHKNLMRKKEMKRRECVSE